MRRFIPFFAVMVLLFLGCDTSSGNREGWLQSPFEQGPGPQGPGSNPGNYDAMEQEVYERTNDERQSNGLAPLTWCDGLADCARAHSHDMCDRGFFDHVNPEGEDPTARGAAGHAGRFSFSPVVPTPYTGIAENIAHGLSSAEAVVQAWMNSPGHRANILNANYTHIGVGNCGSTIQDANGRDHTGCGTHWTQNFGIRR